LNILVNAIGISDSGGIVVLEKFIKELVTQEPHQQYVFIVSKSAKIENFIKRHNYTFISFKLVSFNNYFSRIFYENYNFRKFIKEKNIGLVYNFSGSKQFFNKTPQILKLHNLLFYSKKLDRNYLKYFDLMWFRDIFVKRLVFKFMLKKSKFIEIQSPHVKACLQDYISIKNKTFFIKSDIPINDDNFFYPKQYNFLKKIHFLYIVGPHFKYRHKNLQDFSKAMDELRLLGIDFEINITLSKEELSESKLWNKSLNKMTNFLGYIEDHNQLQSFFKDNTILISTSIIETIGLHVIEGIQKGIITITPDELYADIVYGKKRYKYNLFDTNSLTNVILKILQNKSDFKDYIFAQQFYLKESEKLKYKNTLTIFDEVINV
jgi:hypothetical protein